jgi:plastocyanin
MRKLVLLFVISTLALVAALASAASPAAAATVTVEVGPNNQLVFAPANVTINVGDTVHWVWEGTLAHTSTSGPCTASGCTPDGRWDSGLHTAPFTFDFTFTAPGTYPYFCRPHAPEMRGTVMVQSPLAVTFTSFTAAPARKGVLVRWRTASEFNTLGFNVYREVRGTRRKLNRSLIFGGSVSGHAITGRSYRFLDRRAPRKVGGLRYWLQEVELDGTRTWYGPTSVTT